MRLRPRPQCRAESPFPARSAAARVSIRFATLAQAISSTSPTAAMKASSAGPQIADCLLLEREDFHAQRRIGLGVLLAQAIHDAGHVRLRLSQRDSRLEPAKDGQVF